jgi:hypothetical protein
MARPRNRRFIVCGDTHGDHVDPSAAAAFLRFVKDWRPEIRVHLGDAVDLRFLRSKASAQEQRERVRPDIDAAVDFLTSYKPTHYLRGNHCERLWDAAKCDDGPRADFARGLISELEAAVGPRCQVLPYHKRDGVLRLGHLKVIHGYHSGVTAARQAAQVYGSVLMGHVHAVDHVSIAGLERRMGRCIGCLCKLDQDYNRAQAQTLRQSHGFVYGLLLAGGEYVVWQAEPVGGKWYFPSEVRSW